MDVEIPSILIHVTPDFLLIRVSLSFERNKSEVKAELLKFEEEIESFDSLIPKQSEEIEVKFEATIERLAALLMQHIPKGILPKICWYFLSSLKVSFLLMFSICMRIRESNESPREREING